MILLYVGSTSIGSYSTPVTIVSTSTSLPRFAQLREVLMTQLWKVTLVLVRHSNWHVETSLFLLHRVEFLILVIYYHVRNAEFSIRLMVWLRLHRLIVHFLFLVDLLAVHLFLGYRGRRMIANLGIVHGPIFLLLFILIKLLLLRVLCSLPHVIFSLTSWIVIAYVVDVLLTDGLHVRYFFWVRVLVIKALVLLLLPKIASTHLVCIRAEILMMNLWSGHHDARCYLLACASILWIIMIIIWYLRAQCSRIAWFVYRYLADVSLRYDTWTLIWLQACIRSHTFNTMSFHWIRRISVRWCYYLVCNVHSNVGWRRVKLLSMRRATVSTKIVFTIWPFIYKTISFRRLLVFTWSRYIGSVVLRHSRYFIWNNSIGIWLSGDSRWIFGERILPLINTALSRNTSCQLALVRLIYERLWLWHLLLLTWVIEIIAGKDVIIINCMI